MVKLSTMHLEVLNTKVCWIKTSIKMTLTKVSRYIGDFFYRYCQWILLGIFMVCLYIIVQIKFEITPFLAYSVYADAINEILVNLSFSYIAAYIFYQLTSKYLLTIRNRKIRPVSRWGQDILWLSQIIPHRDTVGNRLLKDGILWSGDFISIYKFSAVQDFWQYRIRCCRLSCSVAATDNI